jgi:predicted  nucleic acid-binding Zn-ribbon protein
MRFVQLLSTLACVTLIAGAALAQPRAVPRGKGGEPPGKGKSPPPATSTTPPVDPAVVCRSRQAVLEQDKNRLEAMKATLAGVDAEIVALETRIAELKKQKSDYGKRLGRDEARIKATEAAYAKDCLANENCQQYEGMAGSLKLQADSVQKEIGAVQTQLSTGQTEVSQLSAAIEPLRTEYTTLACNNLVPGETAQVTIDRCAAIFSDWNRLQARLNQQNQQLNALKARYAQLLAELRNIEARAKGYEGYMAKNCATSPKVTELRGYGGVRERAEAMGKELDKLIEDVAKLRGIQITVTTK